MGVVPVSSRCRGSRREGPRRKTRLSLTALHANAPGRSAAAGKREGGANNRRWWCVSARVRRVRMHQYSTLLGRRREAMQIGDRACGRDEDVREIASDSRGFTGVEAC